MASDVMTRQMFPGYGEQTSYILISFHSNTLYLFHRMVPYSNNLPVFTY